MHTHIYVYIYIYIYTYTYMYYKLMIIIRHTCVYKHALQAVACTTH